jgi:hypothetical protein
MYGTVGGVILAVGLTFSLLVVRKSATPEVIAINNERRDEQLSIVRSREIAITLGETVIPVLTKEHVEAGLRFDKAAEDHGTRWKREDYYGIRSLLLEDLSREDAIISLVTERGMTNTSDVRHALAGMDAVHKPLQSGWL